MNVVDNDPRKRRHMPVPRPVSLVRVAVTARRLENRAHAPRHSFDRVDRIGGLNGRIASIDWDKLNTDKQDKCQHEAFGEGAERPASIIHGSTSDKK